MNEFFAALYTDDADTPVPDSSMYTTSFADLPLASPDSITVTTEFGVLEETGNVTIISAGGATHPYDHQNDDDEYEADVQYQDMQSESGPESYVVMTEDTSAVPQDWVAAVALQHHQQQNSWLLQQQMQNLYNVALGAHSPVYGPPVVPVLSQGPQLGLAPMSGHETDAGDEETDGGEDETDVRDDETDAEDDETDAGDDADIDTDEVHEPPDLADGASTPTAPQHALDPLGL